MRECFTVLHSLFCVFRVAATATAAFASVNSPYSLVCSKINGCDNVWFRIQRLSTMVDEKRVQIFQQQQKKGFIPSNPGSSPLRRIECRGFYDHFKCMLFGRNVVWFVHQSCGTRIVSIPFTSLGAFANAPAPKLH